LSPSPNMALKARRFWSTKSIELWCGWLEMRVQAFATATHSSGRDSDTGLETFPAVYRALTTAN
jgi:hypothetical protein